MNRIHPIRRWVGILAGLAGALLACLAYAPAAFAEPSPHPSPQRPARFPPVLGPGWDKHPPLPAHAHALVTGGMSGWQLTLIVAGAALLAAALAVAVYRVRAGRRRVTVSVA
jgi:hypothetical protein